MPSISISNIQYQISNHPFPYQCFLLVGMQGLGFGALDSVSPEAHGIFFTSLTVKILEKHQFIQFIDSHDIYNVNLCILVHVL